MRNRVLDAVAALNYQPDLLAQSLRTGATMTAGFVVADISNPFMSQVALGAEVRLRESGYSMVLTNSFNETSLDIQHLRLLQQRRLDGFLLSLSDEVDEDLHDALAQLDVPAVLVDRQIRNMVFSSVLSDHASGVSAAVAHLAALGHRRIGMVNDNRSVRPSRERATAVRRTCKSLPGVTCLVRTAPLAPGHGYRVARELLSSAEPPSAIIAGSNQILVGVLGAMRDLNLSFPKDVSLVTCDDFNLSGYFQITTVYRDAKQIGQVAANLLLEQLAGEGARSITLPTELRVTGSCAAPASRGRGAS